MEWPVVIGVCLIIAGIFIAGTALGTRGKALPIIIGIAAGAFGSLCDYEWRSSFSAGYKPCKQAEITSI